VNWIVLIQILIAQNVGSFARKMTPEGLALGAQMAFSRKRKRDIIDDSYHRLVTMTTLDWLPWLPQDGRFVTGLLPCQLTFYDEKPFSPDEIWRIK
jgi:hypothetical protein